MSDKTPVKVYSKYENRVCRLCLQSKDYDRSTNIFSKTGESKEFSRKISYVLGIRVEDDEGFPANICRNCETKLLKFYEFKVAVMDTQAKLRHDVKVKRCKAISPGAEPKQKTRPVERHTTTARSLLPCTTSTLQLERDSNKHSKSQVGASSDNARQITTSNKTINGMDDNECLRADFPLDNDLLSKILNAVQTRLPSVIVATMWNITSLKVQIKAKLLQQLDADCTKLCSRKNPSLLRQKDFQDMVNLDWDKILNDMSSRCPILHDVMTTVVKKSNLKSSVPPLCLCYGILLQQRNHELSLIQRINTVLLSEGNAKKQLISRCQKLGFSLSHSRKLALLDIIGGHFADKVIEEVKQGKKIQGTGDNWDLRIHPHDMRKDTGNQNEDLHYFASSLMVERVPCAGLSNASPQRDIKTLPNHAFLLSDDETSKLREDFKVLVGRVLVSYIPSLSFMKSVIPNHIEHRYQKEMSQQSTIVPLTMQLKDEKHYDDVVDILCEYENIIEHIYTQAGVVQLPPNTRPAQAYESLQDSHSAPDQPGGHFNKYDANDHMKDISVPFGGDQMTRVRFVGAKDLRQGCHTAKDRFDHVCPFPVEFFHTKMSFLQLVFRQLYKPESVREVGTLKYFRERLNRKNVTPEKVTKSYEGCEQFIISTGKAYLIEAAMEFWGMNSVEEKPTKHVPPNGILHLPLTKKKQYFDEVIGAFVDEFVMADPDREEIWQYKEAEKQARTVQNIQSEHDYASVPVEVLEDPEDSINSEEKDQLQAVDRVRYYGLNLLELAVFLMQLVDTCAEGDGDRNNINKKRLLLYFKRFNSFSKYALEMFVSIAQVKAILSEEMAHRLTWGRFVNWNGGQGKNIECDCAQEICNRTCKSVVKGMGANKTKKAMLRASKAAAGIQQIVSLFDKNTSLHKVSQSHSTRSSKGDEDVMFKDLRKLRPFQIKPNRSHRSFSHIEMSPLTGLDMGELCTWLKKHKEQIAMDV